MDFVQSLQANIGKSTLKFIDCIKTKKELKELFYIYYTTKKLDTTYEKDVGIQNYTNKECFKISAIKTLSRMFYFIWKKIDELASESRMKQISDSIAQDKMIRGFSIILYNQYLFIQTLIEMENIDVVKICLQKEGYNIDKTNEELIALFLNKRLLQLASKLPEETLCKILDNNEEYCFYLYNISRLDELKKYIKYFTIRSLIYTKLYNGKDSYGDEFKSEILELLNNYFILDEQINISFNDEKVQQIQSKYEIDCTDIFNMIDTYSYEELIKYVLTLSLKDDYIYKNGDGKFSKIQENIIHKLDLANTFGIGKMYCGQGSIQTDVINYFKTLFNNEMHTIFINGTLIFKEEEYDDRWKILANDGILTTYSKSASQQQIYIDDNKDTYLFLFMYTPVNTIDKLIELKELKFTDTGTVYNFNHTVAAINCECVGRIGHAYSGLCYGKYCNKDNFTIKFFSDHKSQIKQYKPIIDDINDVLYCKIDKSLISMILYEPNHLLENLNTELNNFILNYEYKAKYLKYKQKYLLLKALQKI